MANAEWLSLGKQSIVLAKYNCNKMPCSLYINSSNFRESVISKTEGIFPVVLRPGIYELYTGFSNKVNWNIYNGRLLYAQNNLQDMVFSPRRNSLISDMRFFLEKKSEVMVLSQGNILSIVNNNTYSFELQINAQSWNTWDKNGWNYQKKVILYPGVHYVSLWGKSDVDYWGNLPSFGSGYTCGKYLAIIIKDFSHNNRITITNSQKISANLYNIEKNKWFINMLRVISF